MYSREDIVSLIVLFTCSLVAATGFYFLVIEPRDRAGMAIMECMDGNGSYEVYQSCVEQLSP